MNYKILMLVSCAFLSACGQSGALQLPNDPNYDKRAKYLLYSDAETQKQAEEAREPALVQQPSETEDSISDNTP